MPISRQNLIALIAGGLVLAFLLGFVPMWTRARSLERDLSIASHELALARLQGRLGVALSAAVQQDYERGRQLMASFFTDLQAYRPALGEPRRLAAADELLAQRDEIITLLSRSDPHGTQRIVALHDRWSTAVDPAAVPPVDPEPAPAAEITTEP